MLGVESWAELSPLLDEALDLGEPERAAWLAALAERDPTLARKVQQLLDDHRSLASKGFLEVQPAGPVGNPAIGKLEQTRAMVNELERERRWVALDQRVGNYRITRLLGEGGMGVVYEATHADIGRQVAIKFLHPGLAEDNQMLMRFFNEARAANAIRHRGIVDIHDCGRLPSGAPYIVMELLAGESLRERIRQRGRVRVAKAVDIIVQAADALGAAHARGIVHRDLKPDNLFLVADPARPGQELVKVLDFGIAKLAAEPGATGAVRTRTGLVLGTPRYMSPEQCRGGRDVDHRTDIYALGIILYEMICGVPPFVSPGEGELVFQQISEEPRDPQTRNRDVSEALAETVLKALAKDPDRRFQSMADLRDSLQSALVQTGRSSRQRRSLLVGISTAGLAAWVALSTLRQGALKPPHSGDPPSRGVSASRPPDKAAIRGRLVDDETGRPLIGARVFAFNHNRPAVTTDDHGFFLIPNLPVGPRYFLSVVREGHTEALARGQIPAGQAVVDLGTLRLMLIDWQRVQTYSRGMVGLEHETRQGKVIVTGIYSGFAAHRAGIEPGDRILSVDGKSFDDLSDESRAACLMGPPGTIVSVAVETRSGQTRTVSLTRLLAPESARSQAREMRVRR
jgi:serine/threonine protein kinase